MSRALGIAAGASLAFLLVAAPAGAQQGVADVCAGMATPAEEIACLRGALAESRANRARTREDGIAAGPPVANPIAPAAPPAPEVVQQRQALPPAAVPARQAEQLGAEQVAVARREPRARAPKPEQDRMQALAAAVRTDHLGLVTLRLDNGQIWQQAEARGVPLRLRDDRQYPVEISPSGFGGYRMQFTDLGRQIVVKRLQ